MKWHRNPFFLTVVLPPSVAPSTMTSARPSADIDAATAAAARYGASARPSTDQPDATDADEAASAALSPARRSLHIQHADLLAPPSPRHDPSSASANTATPPPATSPPLSEGILAEAARRAARAGVGKQKRLLPSLPRRRSRRRPKLPKLTILEPSDRLTPYQAFYIFGIDGLGACVLSGGINFAIAYAMYKTINTDLHPIRLFQFPNTLAGDAALTIFIQTVMTWFIELFLVNRDLRAGVIQPIGFLREPSKPLLRWFLLLDRRPPSATGDDTDNDDNDESEDSMRRPLSAPHDDSCQCHEPIERYKPGSWEHWAAFLVSQLIRALLIAVLAWFVMWGPSVGILTAVGDKHDGDWWFDGSSWAPPIFKLVYGAVLALLTTPFFAAFWLVRCGWAIQANQRHLDAAATVAAADPDVIV